MMLSLAGPSSRQLEDVGMEDDEGYFPYSVKFPEDNGKKDRGIYGMDLVDSIRNAVSSVLAEIDFSNFEDLGYPDEGQVQIANSIPVAQPDAVHSEVETPALAPDTVNTETQLEFDEFDLVYPPSPSPPPAPTEGLSPTDALEVAVDPAPIKTPKLSIQIPSQPSPIKPPSSNRNAIVVPAIPSPGSASSGPFTTAPLPPADSFPLDRLLRQAKQFPPHSPVPLRLCSNAGCNGIVKAHSKRRRCMGCILRGWKNRDDVRISPSADSGSSVGIQKKKRKKKKRVSWFDGYSEVVAEDIARDRSEDSVQSDDEQPAKGSEEEEDQSMDVDQEMQDTAPNDTDEHIRGWDSDLTQSDSDEGMSSVQVAESGPSSRLRNYVLHDPAGQVTTGARVCTIHGCKHIVPNTVQYKYKLCFPCRIRSSRNAKIRQVRAKRREKLARELEVEDESEDMALQEAISESLASVSPPHDLLRAAVGRCANLDCGMRLEREKLKAYQEKAKRLSTVSSSSADETDALCEQCTWRRLPVDARKDVEVDMHRRVRIFPANLLSSSTATGSPIETQLKSCLRRNALTIRIPPLPVPPPKPLAPTPYPEYQCLSRLIVELQTLFKQYLQAQTYYLAFNQETLNKRSLAKFSFDGEFSVIAPDSEVLERRNEVEEDVTKIMQDIERVIMLKFVSNSRACAVAYGGLITRFACRDAIRLAFPPGVRTATSLTSSSSTREIMGELEVVVLPVYSHRCFAGQRTVVRLRLVG